MQTAEAVLDALHSLGQKRMPLRRVYRVLYNPQLLALGLDADMQPELLDMYYPVRLGIRSRRATLRVGGKPASRARRPTEDAFVPVVHAGAQAQIPREQCRLLPARAHRRRSCLAGPRRSNPIPSDVDQRRAVARSGSGARRRAVCGESRTHGSEGGLILASRATARNRAYPTPYPTANPFATSAWLSTDVGPIGTVNLKRKPHGFVSPSGAVRPRQRTSTWPRAGACWWKGAYPPAPS